MFHKEELSYEDLEFFINEFIIREDCDCNSCKGAQEATNISIKTDNAICVEYTVRENWYVLYKGRIICVLITDKDMINSPDDIFDYIAFEEITPE